MKIRFISTGLIASIALGTLFTSCNKLKDLVNVNIPLQTADVNFIIQPQAAGTQTLAGFAVAINIDSLLKAENSSLGISNIKKVKITGCKLVLLNSTANDHFGAFSALEVSLASNTNTNFKSIAAISSNPDAVAATLNIPVSDTDLKDYFNSTSLSYIISGTVRRATTTTLNCKATLSFDIQAGL
jgi:hypothetical protein